MPDRPIYRGMTQAELDRAYDNRAHVKNSAAILERWAEESAALYRTAPVLRDLRYGSGPRHRLDFFPAGTPGRPTLFYVHGGYWQWCDKEEECFVARGPLAHDINVAVVEYTLCPETSLEGIVAEIRAALNWLTPRLGDLGAGPGPVIVAGSSAGAHLAAMVMGRADIGGALLVSGGYDLEPIRLSRFNAAIGMDAACADRNSPIRRLPPARRAGLLRRRGRRAARKDSADRRLPRRLDSGGAIRLADASRRRGPFHDHGRTCRA